MKTIISNKFIIKCEQKSSSSSSSKKRCPENKKYENFAKNVVDKRKTEITSIKDTLSNISKNEAERLNDLFNYHVDFFKGSFDEVSEENTEVSINDIIINTNTNDGFFEK